MCLGNECYLKINKLIIAFLLKHKHYQILWKVTNYQIIATAIFYSFLTTGLLFCKSFHVRLKSFCDFIKSSPKSSKPWLKSNSSPSHVTRFHHYFGFWLWCVWCERQICAAYKSGITFALRNTVSGKTRKIVRMQQTLLSEQNFPVTWLTLFHVNHSTTSQSLDHVCGRERLALSSMCVILPWLEGSTC